MPFKEKVVKYLDKEDLSTIETKAANTLVFKNGLIKLLPTITRKILAFIF